MLGQRCGNLKADIFFKHFCRLQDSSMPEVSSTNTRINASKIYKSFAGSFFTICVLSFVGLYKLSSSGGPRPPITEEMGGKC